MTDPVTVEQTCIAILEDVLFALAVGSLACDAVQTAVGLKNHMIVAHDVVNVGDDRRIDLLVSDVGLPGGMNGRRMADAARVVRPDLKVLFITGYAENVFFNGGQAERNMHVLTKPFTMDALARKIKELIVGV
jgi:DNA-binding LytR/AlgR family response regulator